MSIISLNEKIILFRVVSKLDCCKGNKQTCALLGVKQDDRQVDDSHVSRLTDRSSSAPYDRKRYCRKRGKVTAARLSARLHRCQYRYKAVY